MIQPEPEYIITERHLFEWVLQGKITKGEADVVRSHPYSPASEPSSEPNWIIVGDGSDKDWRLISMYELRKLEHAINEECVGKNDGCPPGHLKEMHDSGNEVINKVRSRPYKQEPEQLVLRHMPKPCEYLMIEGMNVHCLDSFCPSRMNCNHLVNWHCWDLSNQRETAIRQSEREKVLDELGNKLYCEFHAYQRTLDVVTGCKKVIESMRRKVENQ